MTNDRSPASDAEPAAGGRTTGGPPSASDLLEAYPDYRGQLTHRRTLPARDGEFVDADAVLERDLADALGHDLYTHQAQAIRRLREGENVTVATSTASGKTYVYALYFALLKRRDPDARALLCYPTKALARDQERALNDLYDDLGLEIDVGVYDGDTPQGRRRAYRENCDVIVSNFAGVNVYLHHHHLWARFFGNCELLVVDESHTYTGVHGMHVAWTIRRLRRVLDHYGSDPQVVCTTATIGNPAEHSRRLTGCECAVVDEDGSPRGEREICFWDPPFDEEPPEGYDLEEYLGAKRSATSEAGDLVAHLAANDVQTIAFARSRQGTEVAAKGVERAAADHPRGGDVAVEPYHAGHGKRTRRETETRLERGDLDAVLATSALELGIDVGSVDATVLAGYPGTRQSFWQRLGRAGRGTDDALSVMIGRADAIDRYLLEHPEHVFGEPVEDAVVDLENDLVYARHLLCAADEMSLTRDDARWFSSPDHDRDRAENRLERAVEMWRDAGKLVGDVERGVQYDGPPRPQGDISMYAASGEQFRVRRADGEIEMEPLDRERAYREFHEGALVLHEGVEYEVVEFVEDVPRPYVTLRSVRTNEYTITESDKRVRDVDAREVADLGDDYRLGFGEGTVTIHYDRYQRVNVFSGEREGIPRSTGLAPIDLRTQLTWIETPPSLCETVIDRLPATDLLEPPAELGMGQAEYTFLGGLHGAEHAMIKLAPLELRMDKSDMGGLSTLRHPETGRPTWFIHDAVEGGVGFAKGIHDEFASLAARTREHVATCDCEGVRGCPACLMDTQCGNRNEPLHAPATVAILEAVLERLR